MKYAISLLKGDAQLPSRNERLEASKMRTKGKRNPYHLKHDQFRYLDDLSEAGKFEKLPGHIEVGFNVWDELREENFTSFKSKVLLYSEDKKSAKIVDP